MEPQQLNQNSNLNSTLSRQSQQSNDLISTSPGLKTMSGPATASPGIVETQQMDVLSTTQSQLSSSRQVVLPFSIQSCRSCYATQHLCQRSFYKIFVKFRNSKNNVLKIVLIIVNINKDENKLLISNQFFLKNDL